MPLVLSVKPLTLLSAPLLSDSSAVTLLLPTSTTARSLTRLLPLARSPPTSARATPTPASATTATTSSSTALYARRSGPSPALAVPRAPLSAPSRPPRAPSSTAASCLLASSARPLTWPRSRPSRAAVLLCSVEGSACRDGVRSVVVPTSLE